MKTKTGLGKIIFKKLGIGNFFFVAKQNRKKLYDNFQVMLELH